MADKIEQTIEVQKKEPFRMNVSMRRIQNRGWLFVDSTIIDARVYINGKNVGLTPFQQPLPYEAKLHQIVVERDGYTRFTKQVMVTKGKVTKVDAYLVRTEDEGLKISLGLFGNLESAERIELQARSLELPADIKPRMAERTVYFVDVGLPPGKGAGAIVEKYGEDKVLLREAATCPN